MLGNTERVWCWHETFQEGEGHKGWRDWLRRRIQHGETTSERDGTCGDEAVRGV